jgi:hypothetical protein
MKLETLVLAAIAFALTGAAQAQPASQSAGNAIPVTVAAAV